jgi:type I restriction enzyme, S subunit
MSSLPNGWVEAPLSSVAFFQEGPGLRKWQFGESGIPFLNIRTFGNGQIDRSKCQFVKLSEFTGKYEHFLLNEGDLVVSSSGTLGKLATIFSSDMPVMLNTSTIRFRTLSSDVLSQEYLRIFLQSQSFYQQIDAAKTGSAILNYGPSHLHKMVLSFPPLAEQYRIVAKLDALLPRVHSCQQRLDKIRKLLVHFRQSVLAAACFGRLTADWRLASPEVEDARCLVKRIQSQRRLSSAKNKDGGGARGVVVDTPTADGIPARWCVTTIGAVSECLDSRRIPVNKEERARRPGRVPYYGANGQVGLIDQHLFDEDLVLVVEDETFVGRQKPFSYIVRGKSWVNNHAHVLRSIGGVSVEYLNACLQYYDFTPLTSGSTGRRKLTQDALLHAPLLIAPASEQTEIVKRIEKLFALADRLEARVTAASKNVSALTQSLLAKAFRGDLVATEAALAEAEGRSFENRAIATRPYQG